MNGSVSRRAVVRASAASAAIFRIGFGVAGLLLVVRFFAHGWIEDLYIDPVFHFSYPGLSWVAPLPASGMYAVFAVLGVAATAIAVGFRHRVFAVVFAMGLAYVELIDMTLYLNHYYWMVLTAVLLAFLPVSNALSVDARRGVIDEVGWVPVWVVWLLRFQVGMVYVFAGIAKLNSDWLFRAEPLATWLPARSELWLVGPLLALPAAAFVLSWAGALFDLTIVFWLSLRRTRLVAYGLLLIFHLSTWVLFPAIGLFPLLMSLGATIFFDPGWPHRLQRVSAHPTVARPAGRISPGWLGLAGVYVLVMVALPLRHLPSDDATAWSGAGIVGSWQVMLNERSGSAEFVIWAPDGLTRWSVGPPEYLTDRQAVVMATNPTLIARTAELVSEDNGGLSVSADVRLSFNGRPSAQYTDPDVIIAGPERSPAADWLLTAPSS